MMIRSAFSTQRIAEVEQMNNIAMMISQPTGVLARWPRCHKNRNSDATREREPDKPRPRNVSSQGFSMSAPPR